MSGRPRWQLDVEKPTFAQARSILDSLARGIWPRAEQRVSASRLRINGYSANLAFNRIHAFVEGPASRAIRLRQVRAAPIIRQSEQVCSFESATAIKQMH